ncbi:MAG: AI-2E family transporter [Gammaproteobacteria bacterium]|jgi:putative permease
MKFLEVINTWMNRHFANEEAIYLVFFIIVSMVVLLAVGEMLIPVFTGLIIAFLLQGLVTPLVRLKVPEVVAVNLAFVLFMGVLIAAVLFIIPIITRQGYAFLNSLPDILAQLQAALERLPAEYPGLLSEKQVSAWLEVAIAELSQIGPRIVQYSVASLPSLMVLFIYLILVPMLVFFFLKDRRTLLAWFQSLLPAERPLLEQVGAEMNLQMANYVRGKVVEIVIVSVVTYIAFALLGLQYAAFLALLVGVSVIVPFIGAAAVTVPVALLGFVQWGWSLEFAYLLITYAIIQALDGNVLVPILFSEAVDLHPVTIIVAVLAFGGLWGIWGVFFAIPLATLVKSIYNAWPRQVVPEAGD